MIKDHATILEECLKEAGHVIAEAIYRDKKIGYKDRFNLVTATDKQAEALIVSKLAKAFPDHSILAEESGSKDAGGKFRWIIDPLDGTTNFAHGYPVVCVSIALEEEGKIILGGVYDPTRNELFMAERGHGAVLNGKSISVSDTSTLEVSLLATGFPYDRFKQERARFYLSFNEAFMMRCHGIRRGGSAALDLSYVACGRFDGFWEIHLHPWDVAAGKLLIEEAGGRITNYSGGEYALDAKETLASNGKIHQEMVDVLMGCLNSPQAVDAMASKKKSSRQKTPKPSKARRIWKINPKSRVKESEKLYDRTKEKADDRKSIDEIINFFGD